MESEPSDIFPQHKCHAGNAPKDNTKQKLQRISPTAASCAILSNNNLQKGATMRRRFFGVATTLALLVGFIQTPAQAYKWSPPSWGELTSTQYYMGYDLRTGLDWVSGGGYHACMNRYGYISRFGVYKITFTQRYAIGRADIVGLPPYNFKCSLYYNSNGAGHMSVTDLYQ